MYTSFVSIAFVIMELIFGMLFFVLSVLSLIQLVRSRRMKFEESLILDTNSTQSILVFFYYSFLTALALLESIFQIWFGVVAIRVNIQDDGKTPEEKSADEAEQSEKFETLFNNATYIPDSLFFITYCLIFSQMVLYNEYAHIRYGNMLNSRGTIAVARTFSVPTKLKILLFCYIAAQLTIITLYNTKEIGTETYNLIDFCFNGSSPVLLIGYMIHNAHKYSGAPLRSKKSEDNIRSLRDIIIYFAVGRLIQCIENFYLAAKPNAIYTILTDADNDLGLWIAVGVTGIDLLVCQLIPFTLTLQDQYVKILSITFHEDKLMDFDDEEPSLKEIPTINNPSLTPAYRKSNNQPQMDKSTNLNLEEDEMAKPKFSITDHKDRSIIQINIDEVQFEGPFKGESVSQVQLGELSLGTVRSGKYKEKRFLIRKLQIKRLSQYLIEEMNRNIQEYRMLSCKFIQPIKALSFDNENVYFFTPYFEQGNLFQIINSSVEVDLNKKKEILKQICQGMAYLYAQSPSISHGHLTPNNIMITKTGDYKLIDFGLAAMKKYVALITGYSTKCQYTAPEQIRDRSLTPSFNQAADIYAFGVIAWEILHQNQAFKGQSLQELQTKVGDEKKRPKIDEAIDPHLALIIRACWQHEQEKRPTFDQISKSLQGGSVSFSSSLE